MYQGSMDNKQSDEEPDNFSLRDLNVAVLRDQRALSVL